MRTRLQVVLLLITLIAVGPSASASAPSGLDSPETVEVGVWLVGIHTLDFLDGSFGAQFYLWWVSRDPEFRPFDALQVLNARDWSVRTINRQLQPDGSWHISGFVSVTVNHDWDLVAYPFDRQNLKIVLETPYNASKLRLAPNHKESVVSKFVDVDGFEIISLKLTEKVEEYSTSLGYRGDTSRQFSRLLVNIELLRESRRIVFAILIGFIVANLIAFLTYVIHVSMLSVRATMVSSAVFAAVGNMYLLNSEVHPAIGSLLVDRFALGTFTVILIALLTGIVVDRLVMRQYICLARKINWTVFALVVPGTALYYGFALHAAIR